MSIRLPVAFLILIQALVLLPIRTAAQCTTPTHEGTTAGVIKFNTVKAQMWFNDGIWWGAFSDDQTGIHFYTFSEGTSIQGPLIDAVTDGIPDVLWDNTNLFVLIRKSDALATLYKYGYDSNAKIYTLISGFPIDLPLNGHPSSAIVLDEDSTGKLWATYTGTKGDSSDGKVHVIWSTSADHTDWNIDGIILESNLDPSKLESSAVIPFGGNRIGIAWSNQSAMELAFRYHIDGEPETTWSEKEVIDSGLGPRGFGPVANDHLSIKAAPDGRIFLVAKDNDDGDASDQNLEGQVWLYIRSMSGWGQKTLIQQDTTQFATRPVLLLDITNNVAYVIYHSNSPTGIERNFITQASMDNPSFDSSCVFTTTPATNPTSTKQNLTSSMGLMAAGSTGGSDSQIVFRGMDLPLPVPIATHVSPESTVAGAAPFSLTVYGSNFVNGSVMRFNGSDRSTSFISSAELTAQITAADVQSAGMSNVSVFNPLPGGGQSNALNFTVNNLTPILGSLSQDNAAAGDSAFALTVHGSNFVNGSVVSFNGIDCSTSFVSSTELTAMISAADLQAAGIFSITVTNPTPGGGSSSGMNFTVNNLVPTLGSLSQDSAAAGDAAFTLTVHGSNFVNGSVMRFNGIDCSTSFVSSTELTSLISAADLQAAGIFNITVANPAPGGGSSSALSFTVNNLTPTLSSLSQTSATEGEPAFMLTVHGSNFINGSIVRFNGSDRSTTFVSSTQLTAMISASDIQSAGTVSISVFNPLPGGGQSNVLNFTVNKQPAKIQFASANYTVNEGNSSVEITVNRTGDSSQSLTVDFATADNDVFVPCITATGAASQRCDYVTTGGTLSFAPGETSKSFTVLLYEDVYLEGDETFRVTLNNSVGATLGTQATATITIRDNDEVTPFYNPINDARFFVGRHYLDLLNRLPDEGGLNYWTQQILDCGGDETCIQQKRIGVSAAFFIEQEFQETGYAVYRLYKAAFGQRPSYAQFMRDRGQLVGGPQLQVSTHQFADRFVNRAEFQQVYPDGMMPTGFVNKLFDTAGLGYYEERAQEIEAMTSSGKTRAQVLLDVIEMQELKHREYNPAFVLMQYFGYLRRDPDQGGYDFWLNVLNNQEPENYRGMVCAFITSSEYQQRTSSVLKRSNRSCGP